MKYIIVLHSKSEEPPTFVGPFEYPEDAMFYFDKYLRWDHTGVTAGQWEGQWEGLYPNEKMAYRMEPEGPIRAEVMRLLRPIMQ